MKVVNLPIPILRLTILYDSDRGKRIPRRRFRNSIRKYLEARGLI